MRSSTSIHTEMRNVEETIAKFTSIQSEYIEMLGRATEVEKIIAPIGGSVSECKDAISSGGYITNPNHIANKLTDLFERINRFRSNLVIIENECIKKIKDYDIKIEELNARLRELRVYYNEALKKERSGKK